MLLMALILGPLILTGSACAGNNQEGPHAPVISSRLHAPERTTSTNTSNALGHWGGTSTSQRRDVWGGLNHKALQIQVASAIVVDENGRQLYAKNANMVTPIASVTKLMTAMIVLDSGVSLDRTITIIDQDRDRLRNSRSRLRIGEARLTRADMIRAALVSSDNRAAHALGRTTFRGGMPEFIKAMNRKARALGMRNTFFADCSGLDARNRSTAEDLVKMVRAAARYSAIRQAAATGEMQLYPFAGKPPLQYRNTNPLVRNPEWQIEVSKTGFINEAGRCLVMGTVINDRRVYIVLLHGSGKLTPVGDSNRIRNWLLASSQTVSR
ncbi:serine hydrolase [Thiorhodococcus fuscus]|uniref:Serine hydrolase n=1 Tax=Thiorhodococcus fuscus TaxID=527200 RepID=A0ABW4Y7E0_9GAMM